jgi:hypothetical protein
MYQELPDFDSFGMVNEFCICVRFVYCFKIITIYKALHCLSQFRNKLGRGFLKIQPCVYVYYSDIF